MRCQCYEAAIPPESARLCATACGVCSGQTFGPAQVLDERRTRRGTAPRRPPGGTWAGPPSRADIDGRPPLKVVQIRPITQVVAKYHPELANAAGRYSASPAGIFPHPEPRPNTGVAMSNAVAQARCDALVGLRIRSSTTIPTIAGCWRSISAPRAAASISPRTGTMASGRHWRFFPT